MIKFARAVTNGAGVGMADALRRELALLVP
jgi:hypothetical protein